MIFFKIIITEELFCSNKCPVDRFKIPFNLTLKQDWVMGENTDLLSFVLDELFLPVHDVHETVRVKTGNVTCTGKA